MALSRVDLLFRGVDIRVRSCRRYPAGIREKFFWSNMFDQISALLDQQGFIPHGHCYLWMPEVLWLHVMSDAIIAVAYFSIPFALAYFIKRRSDLAFKSAFVMFGIFIMVCGLTHVMGIVTIWVPVYWAEGAVKAITAFASLATAAALWPLIPRALTIPSPSALMRSREIQTELRRDLTERQRAENALVEEKERLCVTLSCIGERGSLRAAPAHVGREESGELVPPMAFIPAAALWPDASTRPLGDFNCFFAI
jgi:hypothetical protein